MPTIGKISKRKTQSYSLITHYLGEHIHLKKLQADFKIYPHLNHDHPLVLEIGKDSYAVVTKFGTVTFWNAAPAVSEAFIKDIRPFVESQRNHYPYQDTLEVRRGVMAERVTFDDVWLHVLDIDRIKIISYVSAQSVALERYEEEISLRLRDLGGVVANLKESGDTKLDQKKLLQQVGNVLSVKQHAVSSLALFDKPNEAWEDPGIESLYLKLRDEYELKDRFDILNEKIDFLSENNTTLVNFLSAAKANRLEVIVVALIVIEIILFGLEVFKVFP